MKGRWVGGCVLLGLIAAGAATATAQSDRSVLARPLSGSAWTAFPSPALSTLEVSPRPTLAFVSRGMEGTAANSSYFAVRESGPPLPDESIGPADGSCCEEPVSCCAPDPCPWFGGFYGLLMTRDDTDHYYFSFDDTNEAVQLVDPRDANGEWAGGFETRVGRWFCCGQYAIEGAYWGLYPDTDETAVFGGPLGGNLNGIQNWDDLTYNGVAANTLVDNAVVHRLRRDYEVHNVELNLLGGSAFRSPYFNNACPLRAGWLTGVRYFRFDENLQFAADTVDTVFTGAPEEIYYDIETENNLIGWQFGGRLAYDCTPRFGLIFGGNVGIYGNHIRSFSRIGGAAGDAVVNNGPNAGQAFNRQSHKNEVSFLAELQAGVQYRISPRWAAEFGYRAVAVTGVALPSEQIPYDLRGVNDLDFIASNGSLILHGAYGGLTFLY